MNTRLCLAAGVLLAASVSLPSGAAERALPWQEYDKLLKERGDISALDANLFGEEVSLYNTSLSFRHVDVSLPGNNGLPVVLGRTFAVASRAHEHPNDLPFADWDLDLPRLSGVFATTWHEQRCSGSTTPPAVTAPGGVTFPASQYWHGYQADMPSGGELLLADRGAAKPATGGPYRWMTSAFTYFACLPSIRNASGEGFLAITPDGTRYRFDWMAQYYEPPLQNVVSGPPWDEVHLARKRNVLYATRIEDRFGNWVSLNYSNAANAPARLTSIESSDGRVLSIGYGTTGRIASVSAGTRTWRYEYGTTPRGKPTLTAVVRPDGSRWTLELGALSDAEFVWDAEAYRNCSMTGLILGFGTPSGGTTATLMGKLTHPSGAVGEFEVGAIRHGRSNVPMACTNWEYPTNNPRNDVAVWPKHTDLVGLMRKRITGPGLLPAEWSYSTGATISWAAGTGPVCRTLDCGEPKCISDDCAGTVVTTVLGPGDVTLRYTYGNSYRYNEGKLLKVEHGSGTAVGRTETTAYVLATSGQPFPIPIGTSPQPRGDGFTSEYLRPLRLTEIVQDGTRFTRRVDAFDEFARPVQVTRQSAPAP